MGGDEKFFSLWGGKICIQVALKVKTELKFSTQDHLLNPPSSASDVKIKANVLTL